MDILTCWWSTNASRIMEWCISQLLQKGRILQQQTCLPTDACLHHHKIHPYGPRWGKISAEKTYFKSISWSRILRCKNKLLISTHSVACICGFRRDGDKVVIGFGRLDLIFLAVTAWLTMPANFNTVGVEDLVQEGGWVYWCASGRAIRFY